MQSRAGRKLWFHLFSVKAWSVSLCCCVASWDRWVMLCYWFFIMICACAILVIVQVKTDRFYKGWISRVEGTSAAMRVCKKVASFGVDRGWSRLGFVGQFWARSLHRRTVAVAQGGTGWDRLGWIESEHLQRSGDRCVRVDWKYVWILLQRSDA
jgi:hypothetical protein